MTAPVLGELRPRESIFPTTFMEFDAECGISGMAKVTGETLEILAVISHYVGMGNFRRFVAECKQYYSVIRFWALLNPDLEWTLTRYGFVSGEDLDEYGEMQDLMEWERVGE